MLVKNIYWLGSSLKLAYLDRYIGRDNDFDIVIETNYPKKVQELIRKEFSFVYFNSFGGLKIHDFKSVDLIIINKPFKKVYKNFVELNSDSFFYDLLNEKFVIYDNLFEQSINYVERIGKVIHPKYGPSRSVERIALAGQLNYWIKEDKNFIKNLDNSFLSQSEKSKNSNVLRNFKDFIEKIKKI